MKVGYIWVNSTDQNFTLQLDALKKAGCSQIFIEETKGHVELLRLLGYLRVGDTLVVWRYDRFAMALSKVFELIEKKVVVISLS